MIFKTRKRTSGWTGKHLAFVPVRDEDADLKPNHKWVDGEDDLMESSVDMDLPARHLVGMGPVEFVALLKVQSARHAQTQVVEAGRFATLLEAAQWAWAQNGRTAGNVLDSGAGIPLMIDSIADEGFWSLPIVGADVAYYSPQLGGTLGDTVAF